MANSYSQQFNPSFLSQNQQDLLMAALQSNLPATGNVDPQSNRNSLDFGGNSLDPQMLSNGDSNSMYQNFEFDPQFLDFLDSNGQPIDVNFDEGSPEEDIDPSALEGTGNDQGEKRKSMSDSKQDDENEAKRREGDEKQAKKPGRKPLTSEPTTKRKAQNRAAQRAFRERKEKHLKDLETKVSELEKESESASHENGLLRAQVERLQMELREYRRRLSSQTALNRSPTGNTMGSFSSATSISNTNAFNFDFPRFGSQSSQYGSVPLFGNASMQTSPQSTTMDFNSSNGLLSRHTSTDGTSPSNNIVNTPASSDAMRSHHGSISQDSPTGSVSSPAFGVGDSMFAKMRTTTLAHGDSPSAYNIFTSQATAEPVSMTTSGSEVQNPQSRVFQFNSTASASPSASSSSHYSGNGASSSCGTSPEPTTGINKESTLDTIEETKPTTEELAVDPLISSSAQAKLFNTDFDMFSAALPDFTEPNTGANSESFFNGGLFTEGPSLFDMASPMNWNDLTGSMRTGLTPAVQKGNPFDAMSSPLPQIKEEESAPAEGQMIACNKIWDAIRQREEIQNGSIDIDSLCSELRKKAKCSETGVVIDKNDVDEALKRMPKTRT